MVALSISVLTLVKIFGAPPEQPVLLLTPASTSTLSNLPPPALSELSAETRQQLQATPPQPGPSTGAPGAATGTPADAESPDAKSSLNPSRNSSSTGSSSRPPSTQVADSRRSTAPLGSAQRSNPATGRNAQDPNALDPAEDPDTAAPVESPDPVYVRPETPGERDVRMRRELADSVCDQYGVARERCRARTAR